MGVDYMSDDIMCDTYKWLYPEEDPICHSFECNSLECGVCQYERKIEDE